MLQLELLKRRSRTRDRRIFGGDACASRAESSEGGGLSASTMLNARQIGEEAERAALSLPHTREKVFESYYTYLTVDEPAVHLMPLHFLPLASREKVGDGVLRELAVAGKLEYARNRWLDEMVDHPGSAPGLSPAHRLNDALITLINALRQSSRWRCRRVLFPRALGATCPSWVVVDPRRSRVLGGHNPGRIRRACQNETRSRSRSGRRRAPACGGARQPSSASEIFLA